jgi:hypothetical protein
MLKDDLEAVKADSILHTQVISDVLHSEPVGVSHYVKVFWRRQKRLELNLFYKYAYLVDPSFCAIDPQASVFATWEDLDGNIMMGMRHRQSGLSHGVVRTVKPDD